jgi:hypothetical protein
MCPEPCELAPVESVMLRDKFGKFEALDRRQIGSTGKGGEASYLWLLRFYLSLCCDQVYSPWGVGGGPAHSQEVI